MNKEKMSIKEKTKKKLVCYDTFMNFKEYLRPGKGATDITPLLRDGKAFHALIEAMIARSPKDIDLVACTEGRGFILGSAIAYCLHVGIVPLRYPGKLKNATYSKTYIDYSQKEKTLEIHQDAITKKQKVLIVDDWVETGATVKACIYLVEQCGGIVSGILTFIDDTSEATKQELSMYGYSFIEHADHNDAFQVPVN
ncbi:adenine phosphoribosyltransferase [Candidatus Cerribacteria bacterium 'Amazon FNV 2010 28 9']|uniref:Adenine phosphoribosyltransferase n=1 Tax=Candidatus Cerribacteria bacterium 'Amazon FNV 2010 28 9' TaxID=2081795 RepID=A0A317JQE5_9BACT|nr:MAG: adenine phosphoribosyltransferase [Candidatus Cerribacteria bacterium 'Amazon FNV 2010 28 9']